jgi:aspartyl/asparaginyl beta-hydroxylase (cupin superfamily)
MLELETCERLLAQEKAEFGERPLERIARAVRGARDRTRRPAPEDPLHRPCLFYLPGLRARPWWDPCEFPGVATLEDNSAIIRQELQQLLARHGGFQHFDEGPEGIQPGETDYGWNVFYFRWACRDVPANHALCPGSSRVLQSLPNLDQQVYFSAMQPGTHLPAHCGPYNAVLTVHLGLIIPDGCTLRVGREERTWQEGKCLVFEDGFEHEVWHRGERTRFILLLDVWHPDLTPIERLFLQKAIPAMEDANARAGVASAVERHRGALDGARWWK